MNKYSAQRAPGREHIPLYPPGFIGLRIVQLVFALVVLGLSGYIQSWSFLSLPPVDLNLFTGAATLICCIYYLVAEFGPPNAYNYWAILSLDIFLLIFWLSSFAWMASVVAYISYDYSCLDVEGCVELDLVTGVIGGTAGAGAIEFVLFIVSIAIHSVMMHRHRSAGLHNQPGYAAGPAIGVAAAPQPQVNPMYQSVPQKEQYGMAAPTGVPTYMQQQTAYPQQTMTPPPMQYAMPPPQQPAAYYSPSPVHQQPGVYQQ